MPTLEQLPAVKASLNFLATTLLLVGYGLILMDRVRLHQAAMLSAFVTSIAFLVCYLFYHWKVGHVEFAGPPKVKVFYLTMLGTHVLLAMTVPFLTSATLFFAFRGNWARHRSLARFTFPIWLYVSVTGVLIYMFLYVWFPAPASALTMESNRSINAYANQIH